MIEVHLSAPTPVLLAHEVYKLYMTFVDAGLAPPLDDAPASENGVVQEIVPPPCVDITPAETVEKTLRKRRSPAQAPVEVASGAEKTTPEPVEDEAKADVTFDDVMAALKQVVTKKGFDVSILALSNLGVDRLKQLSADRYGEAIGSFQALLAA